MLSSSMLLILFRIALRNLARNTRRTLITALGIGIGTFVIVFARGLVNGLNYAIIHGVTETRLGDLQLHLEGYQDAAATLPLQHSFALNDRFHALLATTPEITDVSGRIQFSGLVSVGETTSLFFGLGVDPVGEYTICHFQRDNLLEGLPLDPAFPNRVVVGKPLADALGLTLGSELTVLATSRLGVLSGRDMIVGGIIEYKMPGPGSRVIQMPLPTAQKLLHMEDHVTEAIMNVRTLERASDSRDALRAQLAGPFKDLRLEAHAWTDLGKQFLQMMEEQEYVLSYIVIVLYLTMISGIVNTMLMSVFERTQEFGTLMAIGIRRKKLLLMILMEASVLGTLGSLIGVSLGFVVVQTLHYTGFPIPPVGNATRWNSIYPQIGPLYLLWVMGVALICAWVAAIYPALRASRMRPAEALHAPVG